LTATEREFTDNHAGLCDEEYMAMHAGKFVQAMIKRRVFRSAWFIYGWPGRLGGLLGEEGTARSTMLDLRQHYEAYEAISGFESKYFKARSARSPFKLPSVHQLVEPIRADGWVLSDRARSLLKLRESGFKQSRVVEDGFLKERRAEAAVTNFEMAEVGVVVALTQSEILTSRFSFKTHAHDQFHQGSGERLPAHAFRARTSDATMDISSIRGPKSTPAWITHSPGSWTKFHLEPYLMAHLHRTRSWAASELAWLTNLLPNHEPVLVRALVTPPLLIPEWVLVLGVCESTAALVWPVVEVTGNFGEHHFFEPKTDEDAVPSLRFICDLQWELWPCVWASPLVQRVVYGAPESFEGERAGVKLVTTLASEPIVTAAARFGFWAANERLLRKLAKHMGFLELHATKGWATFLEAFIRKMRPDLGDTMVLQIMLRRAPAGQSALEQLMEDEEFREHLDKTDREAYEKDSMSREKKKKEATAYMGALKPLRARVLTRQKVPTGYAGETNWSQALVNTWTPPGSHIFRDEFNARWRIKWMFGNISRSWTAHGYHGSAIACLREAWESHTNFTDLPCEVPGIFDVEQGAKRSQASQEPAAGAVRVEGRGRGRGRSKAKAEAEGLPGRSGRGRGRGRGRAAEAEGLPARPAKRRGRGMPAVEAPPAAACEADAAASCKSSSSSSCSSSSSSSSTS